MLKSIVIAVFIWFGCNPLYAQGEAEAKVKARSKFSELIDKITFSRLEIDESEKAVFRSGTDEYVEFFPATITDLKTGEVVQGLKIVTAYDLNDELGIGSLGNALLNTGKGNVRMVETGFMDVSEIEQLVYFFEQYVNPNLSIELAKKNTVIYEFKSAEIIIRLLIERESGKTKETLAVLMTNRPYYDKYFWTRSQVSKTAEVVKVLKYILAKAKTK
ncbi:MAG: hypothetical protein RMJ44_12355 [Cytophagales bacterium]|nr:hypothetical protein [Bernardetiaceae bacterium]MDW8211866.1 hypothetical protein [Cytophagales bacterium]